MPFIIAVDGPVGAGKSTICDAIAQRLDILHLDTGAMYRAAGLFMLQEGIDYSDEEAVCGALPGVRVTVDYQNGLQHTFLNDEDVTDFIRTQQVGQAASAVSRYPAVRRKMVDAQRLIAGHLSMIVDGRDIGTVVFPGADIKLYLTASAESRAERRMLQLREAGVQTPFEEILAEVNARDAQDMNRKTDPLRQAEDAVLVDSTYYDFEQTVDVMLRCINEVRERKANV